MWKGFEYAVPLLFVHFVGWASVPESGGGLFRHLLHLTSLAAVVIFWLNDAWKWISIFCDQKRCVMPVRYMHYKQPGCWWERHTGLWTSEGRNAPFQDFLLCPRLGQHILKSLFRSVFFLSNPSTLPHNKQMPFLTKKAGEMDCVCYPRSHFKDPRIQLKWARKWKVENLRNICSH